MTIISNFVSRVEAVYQTGRATEHSYRPALEELFGKLAEDVSAINEPTREACGAPDFLVQQNDIVIGHIEAKDVTVGLRKMKGANKNQQDRYRKALANLIYTNGLDWDFYRNGELYASVTIADLLMGVQPKADQFEALENLLHDFVAQRPQSITSPKELAERMAGKAVLIKDVLGKALIADADQETELTGQYSAFKEHLIHDITIDDFADIYAETIAYGMFAARLHDQTLETFSRQEALDLLPKSNPFLRSLFGFIAGQDLDDRIAWVIDDLARVFGAANVAEIMEGFGTLSGRQDPFLHFYETFLAAYNPAKRKARGVWYTPEPVVNFIVRAVDEVLQTEFSLADGLADTSKVTVDWETGQTDKRGRRETIKKEVHRVQILDPATGTGTFLAEAIKQIAPKVKGVAEGMWSQYVEQDLIPRLHGFELLMASYAMCHMKLDMILTEMGYEPTKKPPRLSVYLTNSLEEGEPANQTLPFAQWLSNEVKQANTIKRDMPIMCVIGNPPYSGESANKGDWIMSLMDAYKKEPGGKEKLKERNPKWINDDYVKFIRFSEHLIEKNGEGVLGFITNHGYLDNPTFRGMRWHLLKTFDKIYVLDLHGNSKKKEVTPEGKPDKNVFDIQQGVAIVIAVKKTEEEEDEKALADVFHRDLWGDRKGKYSSLWEATPTSGNWDRLEHRAPQFPFVMRDYAVEEVYQMGFGVQEFMPVNSVGIVTARDALTIDMDKSELWKRVQDFSALDVEQAREKYDLGKDVRDWSVQWAQDDVKSNFVPEKLVPITYRPFDIRWTFYTGNSRGFMCYPRKEVMRHIIGRRNLGLAFTRTVEGARSFADVLVFNGPITHHTLSIKEVNAVFPFQLYPDEQDLDQTRRVNFDPKLYKKLRGLAKDATHGEPDEVQVFDYIYGVLHCPAYRETYAEFLKIDFPRIPWPASPEEFWDVSEKGTALRKLHLMESEAIGDAPYPFKGDGDGVVDKLRFEKPEGGVSGKVWINKDQYFDMVPEISWGFYIGGYQPAQKWLKDRKGRELSFDDVKHYQRIVKILAETDRIMQTIDLTLQAA